MIIVVALAWTLGVFLASSEAVALEPGWGALAFCLAAAAALYGAPARARGWSAALGLLSLVAAATATPTEAVAPLANTTDAMFTGRVRDVRYGPDKAWSDIDINDGRTVDGNQLPRHRVRLRTAIEDAPPPGSDVRYRGALRPSRPFRNISPHPRWPSARSFQSRAVLKPETKLAVERIPASRRALHHAQQAVRAYLRDTLSASTAGMARALVLGDGGAISREERRRVAAAGLAHLLAVSGLHISLLSGACVRALESLLCRVRAVDEPRRLSACLGIPLALAHALFAGGSPSAWRAAVTASIGWALVALGRKPGAREVMAGAVLVLSGLEPALVIRPAFLLSVTATAAIVTAPRAAGRFAALRAANTISWRTLAATTPIVWWCFGEVPIVAWWSNIVLLPIASVVLVPLANAYALTVAVPGVGAVLAPALEGCVRVFLFCCETMARLVPSPELPPLDVVQGVILSTGVAALLLSNHRRTLLLAAALVAFALLGREALISAASNGGELRVTFADIGQGDAAIIDLPDGRLMLIDTGPGEYGAGEELIALLRARRETHIDIIAITHGHPDHFGALPALLDTFTIDELWVHGQALYEQPEGTFAEITTRARRLGTRVRKPGDLCRRREHAAGASIHVLSPCPRYEPALGLNDNSLIIRVDYQGRRILFTGDVERERERELIRRHASALRADVLKVGHHGSRTSSTRAFLRSVAPSVAIISSGTGNGFGHPHEQVLDRLRRQDIDVLRTDRDGGVIATIANGELDVVTWRSRR